MTVVAVMTGLTSVWAAGLVYRRRLPEVATNVLYAATAPLMVGWCVAYIDWCRATGNCP